MMDEQLVNKAKKKNNLQATEATRDDRHSSDVNGASSS